MDSDTTKKKWRTCVSVRIVHRDLDPEQVTTLLHTAASIAKRPGESRIPHGDCNSAGYWGVQHWIDEPKLPDHAFLWAEQFVAERLNIFKDFRSKGYGVNVYVGVFSNLLALGFDIPATPTLWELGIIMGIEYFSA